MKNEIQFTHLRVHSSYSLSQGAITPEKIINLCKKNSHYAVAITDSGNLFGSLEFSSVCSKNSIQPIIGCVLDVEIENETKKFSNEKNLAKILLLAQNDEGYQNLLKLVSYSFLKVEDASRPFLTINQLQEYNEGIIALTGGVEGILGELLINGQFEKAESLLLKFKDIYSDRIYIELMRHGQSEQIQIEPNFIELAYKHNIPLVATNDVYFATLDMHEAHDILLCIADGRYVTEKDRKKKNQEHFFKSTRQMVDLFSDIPEAIINTNVIAQRCAVMSQNRPPMLPHYPCEKGNSEAEELKYVASEGLKLRLKQESEILNETYEQQLEKKDIYFKRLEYELGIIIKMDFPGYFLIVSDFIRWGKSKSIPIGPGRGSGAGSIIAWALQITDLDPIKFGLIFERFLNPERVSMPDFDIDFCQERREEVIKYVQKKYGYNKVAQIITFGKLQAKAVLRDVGRVLQMPYGQIDRITKMIPFNPIDPVTLEKALKMDRELRRMQEDDADVGKLLNIGLKLEGLNRHASTHAAGIVIADRPLEELVPVYRDPRSDMPVSGYSMKYTENAGLVKFDFLGLKTLTVISKCCEFIENTCNKRIDISKIPIQDKQTFKMLSAGTSIGIFQLESAGMRDTLRKLRPDNVEDIIALISLYRPGPMDNIPSYIARKHDLEEVDYLDPMFKEVLEETYGVIIYQEQVMKIAQIMGGYSLGAADLLRRAMGKKIASEMDAQRKIFVSGAIKQGVLEKKASEIFDLVAKFAGYGFNKSHAAAYAMISYQTAYLKAHYPVEFLAASMNLEINDTDKIATFKQDMVNLKIEMLLPDINQSESYFIPQKSSSTGNLAVRYGLGALKNVGCNAMEKVISERKANGEYKDIFDFISRQESSVINKRQLEGLIRAGAFDNIDSNRKQLFDSVESLTSYGQHVISERGSNQSSLFGDTSSCQLSIPVLKVTKDWSKNDKLAHEFAAIGLYLNSHPINDYEKTLDKMGVVFASNFEQSLNEGNSDAKFAGVVISKKIRSSPRGRFATLTVSDPTGIYEASIYDEDILANARDLLENGSIIFICAQARKDEGGVRITIDALESLEEVIEKQKKSFKIILQNTTNLYKIQNVLGAENKGNTSVKLELEIFNKRVLIQIPNKYLFKSSIIEELKLISCVKEIIEN